MTQDTNLESICSQVIKDHPRHAEQTRKRPVMAGWFVGKVMKITSGKARPERVREILLRKLEIEP